MWHWCDNAEGMKEGRIDGVRASPSIFQSCLANDMASRWHCHIDKKCDWELQGLQHLQSQSGGVHNFLNINYD